MPAQLVIDGQITVLGAVTASWALMHVVALALLTRTGTRKQPLVFLSAVFIVSTVGLALTPTIQLSQVLLFVLVVSVQQLTIYLLRDVLVAKASGAQASLGVPELKQRREAVILFDGRGQPLTGSGNCAKILGLDNSMGGLHQLYEQMGLSEKSAFERTFAAVLNDNEVKALRITLEHGKEKRQSAFDVRLFPVEGGLVSASFVSCQGHVEELDTLEAALKAEQHRSAAFMEALGRASHELKTPLNAITGFAELLQNKGEYLIDAETEQEYLRLMGESGKQMTTLLKRSLDISSLESGHYALEVQKFDLGACLTACVELMRPTANKKGVQLQVVDCEALGAIEADETACQQIIMDLLSNAVNFSDEGGEVTLSANRDADNFAIQINDEGVGIDTPDLARICEPFFQGGSAKLKKQKGAGLGLTLAKGLTERQGGKISISSGLGRGTSVKISLPRRSPASTVDLTCVSNHLGKEGRKVA
ncbi:HAMP domain-containing histidine kinase [Rhodobacteraceae bacterium RKSG542]|uniref:sensor histidine kinase n=1 Tax=Pseudovibrio flavus TaxID=2529854 RepID=UPI0012BB56C0|nr:HAMP domain-containing histidine kinase [Pseudovibrio flavus]